MKIHHFIIDGHNLSSGIINDTKIVNQIIKVLKLRIGEIIWIGDGDNHAVLAEIADFNGDVNYVVREEISSVETLSPRLVLACSIIKKENFELVVQKATELGVHEIVPFISARTVKTGLRYDRLQIIAREAAEQSGRGVVPAIREAIDFENLPDIFADFKNKFLCFQEGESIGHLQSKDDAVLVVGPEGGFEDREVEFLKNSGFKLLKLSNFTLRAETATIVALAKLS